MNEAQITWMVLGFAVLGIGAAVIHIFQTSRKERYWFHRQKPMTEQLASYPENVEAVLVKGDKKALLIVVVTCDFDWSTAYNICDILRYNR